MGSGQLPVLGVVTVMRLRRRRLTGQAPTRIRKSALFEAEGGVVSWYGRCSCRLCCYRAGHPGLVHPRRGPAGLSTNAG